MKSIHNITIITLLLSEIEHFIDSNSHLEDKFEYKKLNQSIDELKYNAFKNLMKYYQFGTEIKLLNEELKGILLINDDLNQTSIRNWL